MSKNAPKFHKIKNKTRGRASLTRINFLKQIVMSKILRIEGAFEIIGFFVEGQLVRTTKRRVTNWK